MKIFMVLVGMGMMGFGASLIFGGTTLLVAVVAQVATLVAVVLHRAR